MQTPERVLLDVICPAGVEEGDSIAVEHGDEWLAVDVPPGVSEGDTFQVEVDAVAAPESPPTPPPPSDPNDIISVSDDDDETDGMGWYYSGPDQAAGSAAKAVVQEAVRSRRLTPHEASALRRIMAALNSFGPLDELVSERAVEFADYRDGGEQRLEWTTTHRRFVELVEARISAELDQLAATTHDLYAMLAAVSGQDEHADGFLARLLSLNDYTFFCQQMALGGGTLGGSVDDAV